MLRLDSHVLLSEPHPPEHISPILTRNRFDGAILFAPVCPPIDNIRAIVIPTDLSSPDLPALLDRHQAQPRFAGVAITLTGAIPAGVAELARRGIPLDVDLHPAALHLIPSLAAEVPRLVIDHMARPNFEAGVTPEWAHAMESAARCPNVFCKVSGLLTDLAGRPWSAAAIRPFVQHVLAVFGKHRVMFGSEWPRCLPDATWKETLAAFTQSIGAHSMETRELLLGANAQRFYALP